MKSEAEYIAAEIMDTIERERRINKDDLVMAVELAMARYDRDVSPTDADWQPPAGANAVSAHRAAFKPIDVTHAHHPSVYHGDPATNAAVGVDAEGLGGLGAWVQSVTHLPHTHTITNAVASSDHTHTITNFVAPSDTVAPAWSAPFWANTERLGLIDGEVVYYNGTEWVKV